MENPQIPEAMVPEVFTLAAQLYAEKKQDQGFSLAELTEAGTGAQIPSEFVAEAVQQIRAREAQIQEQKKQAQKRQNQLKIALLSVGAIASLWLMWTYNTLSSGAQNVELAWSQVENQFQRRADLIPNLVNVTRAGAQQEQELITLLTQSRQNYLAADTRTQQVEAAEQVTEALDQFQSYVVRNPQLQSNQLFIGLQYELAGTENRIAVERMRYNQNVAAYNRRVQSFPNSLVASVFGFKPKPLFRSDRSEPPVIFP